MKYSVQKPIIDYVQEPSAEYVSQDGLKVFLKLGWQYVAPDDALRMKGGESGMVFREIFIQQLQRLNPDFLDHLMAEELIKKIETLPANIEEIFGMGIPERAQNGFCAHRKTRTQRNLYRHRKHRPQHFSGNR